MSLIGVPAKCRSASHFLFLSLSLGPATECARVITFQGHWRRRKSLITTGIESDTYECPYPKAVVKSAMRTDDATPASR